MDQKLATQSFNCKERGGDPAFAIPAKQKSRAEPESSSDITTAEPVPG